MSTNVAGFLDFAKRTTMCCLSFKSHVNQRSRISGFRKAYHHVLSIFKSHLYKSSRISGFGRTYQHELSVLKPYVEKRSGISDLKKRINMSYPFETSCQPTQQDFWLLQNVSP